MADKTERQGFVCGVTLMGGHVDVTKTFQAMLSPTNRLFTYLK
jgi:hypothetical protein